MTSGKIKKSIKLSKNLNKYTITEKLNAMKIIEDSNGNVPIAAASLGLHKTTLYKWKAEYWEEYLDNKNNVTDNMLTIQAKKMMMFTESEQLIKKSANLFEKAIDFFNDGENFEKLPAKEKVNLVNVILPYVIEKRNVMGVKANTPAQQNNFFQNVFAQMRNGANNEYPRTIQGDDAQLISE